MKIKAIHTIKFNGKFYPPGTEIECPTDDAAHFIKKGAAVEIKAAKRKAKPKVIEQVAIVEEATTDNKED